MSALGGYLCALISVLGFGSNFTVVAKYDPGDGMFFQLVLCIGIWCTGLVIFLVRSTPTFYPLALLGGVIWCSGNCAVSFVIKSIGLGPGLVTWGTAALLIGWLTGFFGLFGLHNERPCMQSVPLNVIGFLLSVCALVVSLFIKKGAPQRTIKPTGDGVQPLTGILGNQPTEVDAVPSRESEEITPQRRMLAMLTAVGMGVCFGTNFHPSTWIQVHVDGASQDGLDYVFNQFCGILVASIFYFLVYAIYMRNQPAINPQIIVPGFLSGVLWAIAQACWFVANAEIGYSAAFPIILIGPGFVGSLWSIFLFKDIYGARNYQLICVYFILACSACACIVLSRKSNPPPPCAA